MKRLLFALAVLVGPARAGTPTTTVPWFDGRDLGAWEFVTAPAVEIAAVVKFNADGSLAIAGKPVGFLASKASYENYRLHAEWRWPANAAKNSNGGILLHVASGPAGGTPWPQCFQMQLKLTRAGDLLPMHGAKFGEKLSTPPDARTPQLDRTGADSEKPLGEWNSCDIVCRGGTLEVTINGVPQNKVTGCSPAAGRIGIQLEGAPFELRNVRIAPLD